MPPMKMSTRAHVSTDAPMNMGAALARKPLSTASGVARSTRKVSARPATALEGKSVKLNVPV